MRTLSFVYLLEARPPTTSGDHDSQPLTIHLSHISPARPHIVNASSAAPGFGFVHACARDATPVNGGTDISLRRSASVEVRDWSWCMVVVIADVVARLLARCGDQAHDCVALGMRLAGDW